MAGKTRIGNLAKRWKDNPPGVDYPNTWTPPADVPWKYEDRVKAGLKPISTKKKRAF